MSDATSINTLLLDMIISSKNDRVFNADLDKLTPQIIFDGSWTCMNVDSKLPIPWDNSSHAPSGAFYLHCGMEETGSLGIIHIICHQAVRHQAVRHQAVRHQSQHGTSLKGKHLPAKTHILWRNELTESDVSVLTKSTVNETAFTIPK
jgi:hypothetical protein